MNTSWEDVAEWYDKIVGQSGHYFHEEVIFPHLAKISSFDRNSKVLDMGCGNGVLAKQLPKGAKYVGVDASKELVRRAGSGCILHDLTEPLDLKDKDFTHITFILSLQNMKDFQAPLLNAKNHLAKDGRLFIVLNHPCFRVPRQTSWGVDAEKKIQYRRIDRYLSPLEIPIAMQPGAGRSSETTFSYHAPLSSYISCLGSMGLGVMHMEEWISEKVSTGKAAKMENRARSEFPLFLLLVAKHFSSQ